MIYDYIQPRSKSGETTFENLCLACCYCNEFKADLTEAIDPLLQRTQHIYLIRVHRNGLSILLGVLMLQKQKALFGYILLTSSS
ncbi:HNH endonuclease [Chlorogloeopsis sp. ULAP02]|uniref:HNH endonuclease n=1 Tax=Chlorogloeopsis sp. ULAP02 TaxID=3107926 RepID=UPI003136FB56